MEGATEPKNPTAQVTGMMEDENQPITSTRSRNASISHAHVLDRVSHEVFRYDHLDRKLKRHHITGNPPQRSINLASLPETGIAFSGAVGIGLFQTSGQVIALGGPVGALLAFIFGGLIVISVMRCLAEMVSVRPVKGALMDFSDVFVDEALGFAVGLLYWSVKRPIDRDWER